MTTQNNDQEVKEPGDPELDETLTADDLEDPESKDLGDAIVADPENAPPDGEKETPAASSAEDKPADEEKSKDDSKGDGQEEKSDDEVPEGDGSAKTEEPAKKEPKPVPGETPREKALRLEVERMRRINRDLKGDKLFKDVKPEASAPATISEEEQKAFEAYDPEQVTNLRKVIGVIAKQEGWVKKDEQIQQNYQGTAKVIFDDFMEAHPEYSEEKDPDGVLWKRFQQEFGLYQKPKDPKDLKRIFSKIHRDIFGVQTDTSDLNKVEAQKEKIKVSSHGSGAAAAPKAKQKTVDPELTQLVESGAMKGFDEEDLKEMGLK